MSGFTLSNKAITKIEPMTENIRKNFLSVAPITPKWSRQDLKKNSWRRKGAKSYSIFSVLTDKEQ